MADGTENSTPRRGWTCIEIVDLGPDPHKWPVCKMCETATPRYRHIMEHPDYIRTLDVGCVCAGRMEQNPVRARKREREFRGRERRANGWLTRDGWRVSQRGNSYLKVQGCNIVIWRTVGGWRLRVLHKASGWAWESDAPRATEDEAKLAAFDKLPKNSAEFRQLIAEAESGARKPNLKTTEKHES